MKILLGSFQCESNTFFESKAQIDDFEVFEGTGALDKLAATKVFEDAGARVIPLTFASALPNGEVSQEAFEYFKRIFISQIAEQKNVDGIYLYLHGSMYVENIGSGEQALVEAIRETIGHDIPISLAMDFHANVSPRLLDLVNAVNGFRTAPHTDHDDTERRAARALLRCITENFKGRAVGVHLPFLCGDAAVTSQSPFPAVTNLLEKLDSRPEIISCAFFNGQPWYDSPYTGACAVVSAMDKSALKWAKKIAKLFWDGRELLQLDGAMAVDEAVDYSLQNDGSILFVTDSGDNTTAGAEGAGTLLLKKYIERKARNVLICGVYDKENTDKLLRMKDGESLDITLCQGKRDEQEQELSIQVTLKGRGIALGWAGDEVGEGVLVSCDGLDIVLTNARSAFTTPEHFKKMNIEPRNYKVVVLKMGYLFPKLKEISKKSIMALTPGQSTNDFATLRYKRLKRNMYPIYKDIEWSDIEANLKT